MAKFHKILKTFIHIHIHISFVVGNALASTPSPPTLPSSLSLPRYVKMPQSYILPQVNDKIQITNGEEGDFNERASRMWEYRDVWVCVCVEELIMQKQTINIAVSIWREFSAFIHLVWSIFSCLQVFSYTHTFSMHAQATLPFIFITG